MTNPRRRPNMTEKLAAALCEIQRNGVWLIPEPLRLDGTAKAICAAVEWDHATPWTWTQDNRPQNLTPMLRTAHRDKTRRDVKAIAKVRRAEKRKAGKARKSRPMPYTQRKSTHKRTMAGKVVLR